MSWAQQFLQRCPELAIYLSLGLGFAVGRAGSSIAVLGDSGPVAIAHVLLPTWGSVIVASTSGGSAAPPP
jgi:hypothetical protein